MSSLVETLQPRVELISRSVSRVMKLGNAYGGGAAWENYDKYPNRIKGTLVSENDIEWSLASGFAGYESARLYTRGIRPLSLAKQEFGDTNILGAPLLESHHAGFVTVPEGATYRDTLSFTWNKLTTREDAYTQGLKATLETWVRGGAGSSQSGFAIGGSTTQEFTAEFNQKYGSQVGESTTFSREVVLTEPGMYSITYTRRSGDAQQRVTARGDYEFSLTFEDQHQVKEDWGAAANWWNDTFAGGSRPTHNLYSFGWASMTELLAVMRREAPNTYALYQPYMDFPEDSGVIEQIAAPPGEASFVLNFKDNVSYDVVIRKTIDMTPLTPATPRKTTG